MRIDGVRRATAVLALTGALLAAVSGCGGAGRPGDGAQGGNRPRGARSHAADPDEVAGVGDRLLRRIPAESGQVVAVYGDGRDSANATVVLFSRRNGAWQRTRSWAGHNGKKGWTTDHRAGDLRSPVGVFTLTDAGGVLVDPGARLPYTRAASFAAPHWWAESHWHDFDYVIAIDYNRVKGTSPNDPTRPEGEAKGGSIWLHMDHGSGTSGCVSVSKPAMQYLLRTLDPGLHPVIVMGDKADLAAA